MSDNDELNRKVDEYIARKAKYDHPHKVVKDGKVISDGEDDPDYQQWQFQQSLNIYVPTTPPAPPESEARDDLR